MLPTNGMRACTAAPIELRYDDGTAGGGGRAYSGEVEFIGADEWEKERDSLLEDLTTEDGRVRLSIQPTDPAFSSFCRMFAVYGRRFSQSSIPDPSGGSGTHPKPCAAPATPGAFWSSCPTDTSVAARTPRAGAAARRRPEAHAVARNCHHKAPGHACAH